MEASGLPNVEDPIHLFTLHTIFILGINKTLEDFSEAFNNHAVSTEGNWTPYQIWMNGMMHRNNPLAHGALDGEPDDLNNNNNKLKFIPRSFYKNIQLRLTISINLKIK